MRPCVSHQNLHLCDCELIPPVAASSIVQIVLFSMASKYMAITIPFVLVSVYTVQRFYLKTSRQLRLLDLEAKAPLYSHFMETLSSLVTIRAFERQTAFQERQLRLLKASQHPIYLLYCVQRWLSVVLDLLVGAVAVILITVATQIPSSTTAGALGVGLVNIINFNQGLTNLVRFWASLETSLGAVLRVKDYTENTAPEKTRQLSQEVPGGWPTTGALEFDAVSAAHGLGTPS